MGILAQDNGSSGGRGSPNAWSPGSDNNNYTQQRSNQTLSFPGSNQLTATNNGSGNLGIITYSSTSVADQEVLTTFTPGSTSTVIGAIIRWSSNTNFYYADLFNSPGNVEIGMNGTFTQLGSAAFSASAGTQYSMRFRAKGTTLQVRVWATASQEPSTWNVTITDATNASGQFGVCTAPPAGFPDVFASFSANDTLTASLLSNDIVCDGLRGWFQ